jgi:hypothetical protein
MDMSKRVHQSFPIVNYSSPDMAEYEGFEHNISSLAQIVRRINFEILTECGFLCPRSAISGICKRNDKSTRVS